MYICRGLIRVDRYISMICCGAVLRERAHLCCMFIVNYVVQELISEECLRKLLYPHLGREAGHFSPDWIARFLVQLRDRGVILEKRYIIEVNK
jgi:hypothetical protein